MSAALPKRLRCAVYTRKSTDEGLDAEYTSIDAQRDAGAAFIASRRMEGWIPVAGDYDDGGFSGGTLLRPAFNASWKTSAQARSTSSWSTRSTA